MARRRILAPLLLLIVLGGSAQAGGISLRWDHCYGDAGVINKNFACSSNVGINNLAESFVLPAAVNDINYIISHIEITTANATFPAWWQFVNVGACRQSSFGAGLVVPAQSVACVDWAGAQGSTAVTGIDSYTIGAFGPSTASFRATSTALVSNLANLNAGQEYGANTFFLNHAKTVGSPSCAGCSTPACIYLRSVEIFDRNGALVVTLTAPANGTDSNTATWQGGTGVPALPGGACSGAVPVRNSTWGSVKTLYR